ncbi:MAG: 50S ribosomal protein L3 [Candidatus Hydrogenedentes bacterium]|nr:50S ribosomal protein L3 [Candidatus Hydrogenedentota bacterium]
MAEGLLGTKLGMTRIFTEDGRSVPVTVVEAGPCVVVQRKTTEIDGYESVQIGFGTIREKRVTKPLQNHFAKAGAGLTRHLREFRVDSTDAVKPGDELKADQFAVGDHVDVTGTSIGKGFAGVMKRFGYKGGPGGHGSNFHRRPGSVGQSADPAKILKGKGMPGHMGARTITTQNLEVVRVDAEKNLLLIRGCVPGAKGGTVVVRKSVKTKGASQ